MTMPSLQPGTFIENVLDGFGKGLGQHEPPAMSEGGHEESVSYIYFFPLLK